jgi:hypothetical protein
VSDEAPAPEGKGRPTPKRADARKARRNAMPSNRKEAAALQRERNREARMKARQALISGDERHLPARDAGPERRLARDIVDSRFTIGQVFIFLIFAVLIGGTAITGATKSNLVQSLVNLGSLAVFTAVIVDCARCGRMAKKAVGEKFGIKEARGISSYAFIRAMQPRRFRRPPPKVARGGAAL